VLGHYEHVRGTTSHYGMLYNLLMFNDGYHVEHHAWPARHWSVLPDHRHPLAQVSAWPAVLRWMEWASLEGLERLVLRSQWLERFVLRVHRRALGDFVALLPTPEFVGIVGGGLFPRTAMIVRELLPFSRISVIEADRTNLEIARARMRDPTVEWHHARFDETQTAPYDLLVLPLSFANRSEIYTRPPAPAVIVHDWIWRPRGRTRIVSMMLLKRVNLVRA